VRAGFEYAVVRVVPDPAREEFVNVGVIVLCERAGVLRAAFDLDEARLRAIAPCVDLNLVRSHLAAIERVSAGTADAGLVAGLPLRERFGWLVAPRSTMIQTSVPHGGVTGDVDALLAHLLDRMVRAAGVSGSTASQAPPTL
jgi:Protein of unknown function (DUF3037)